MHTFSSCNELDRALSQRVAQALREAIAVDGHASLAVSGGKTPLDFFQCLSREQLAWRKVTITLVDERWVDDASADSNARLVKDNLLRNAASSACFIGLKTAATSPFAALPDVEARLAAVPWPLTVAVLGMGLDGHTASFFPKAEALSTALSPSHGQKVAAIHPPDAAYDRITLTLPALLDARQLFLHIVGENKWQVLQTALQPGDVESMPVRAVLRGRAKYTQHSALEIFYTASET